MIRDRIKELRRVKASELMPNPANWRQHPKAQADALREVLTDIGYADALIARETPAGLELLDGHLRAATTPDEVVPVLIIDVDDAEALTLLASHDPIAAMAETNRAKLAELMPTLSIKTEALTAMLQGMAREAGLWAPPPPNAPSAATEWVGMPAFDHEDKTPHRTLALHFADDDAVNAFSALVGQTITDRTRYLWYPEIVIERYADKQYA